MRLFFLLTFYRTLYNGLDIIFLILTLWGPGTQPIVLSESAAMNCLSSPTTGL
jgi:hypothetical protein